MKNSQQYLDTVRNGLSRFNNATGNNFRNATGNGLVNAPGAMGRRATNWNANGSANAMPSASPIILKVSNASNVDVANFPVFGAATYLTGNNGGGTWAANGNFTLLGITISSYFSSVSYQQILNNTQNSPFTAGSIQIQVISGNQAQASEIYTVNSVSNTGQSFSDPVSPFLDSYQFLAGITYNTISFNMSGLTQIIWNTVYALTTFKVSIFPAQTIDTAAALNGAPVQTSYTRPKVIGNLRG